MKTLWTALLTGLLLGASGSNGIAVPIEIEHGVLFVWGELDGVGPLLFVLDPAAGDFMTTYASSRLRGRPPTQLRVGDAPVPVTMEAVPGEPSLLVPSHDRRRGAIAGSIGPALLKHYALGLDYAASTMTLTPLETFAPPAHAERLPFTLDEYGMPVVEARIDGITARFELDVRAPTSMLFAPFLQRSGLGLAYANAPVVKHSESGVAHAIDAISVGGHRLHAVTAWFSQDSTGKFASASVAGLLGNNVWSNFVVTLDYRDRAAYIESPVK